MTAEERQELRFARLQVSQQRAERHGYVVVDQGNEYPLLCRFNRRNALRVERFFRNVLRHTEGDWAGRPFLLEPWQKRDIIYPLFGWQRWDWDRGRWVRQYSNAFVTMGRGNGKTAILSGIALYLMLADGEPRAEIYGAAADQDQAKLAWNNSMEMVKASPMLRRRVKVTESKLLLSDPKTGSFYVVLGGMDFAGNLGQKPHGLIIDELGAIAEKGDPRLIESLRRGLGKRAQPLMMIATTAMPAVEGMAFDEHRLAEKVEADPTLAPTKFVFMRSADENDDPEDPTAWAKASPALGNFLAAQTLIEELAEAKLDPVKMLGFKVFRMNIWSQPATEFIPLHRWDMCPGEDIDEDDLAELDCWGGVDLSASTDLTAVAWAFPNEDGTVTMLWRLYIPEGQVAKLNKVTGGQFQVWIDEGHVQVCAGDMIDYDLVHDQIDDDTDDWYAHEVGIDKWNAAQTFQYLQAIGVEAAAIKQGLPLSGGLKELSRLVIDGKLRHGSNPAVRWCLRGARVKMDGKEQIQLVRPERGGRTRHRVDPIAAAAMALDRMMNAPQDETKPERIPLR